MLVVQSGIMINMESNFWNSNNINGEIYNPDFKSGTSNITVSILNHMRSGPNLVRMDTHMLRKCNRCVTSAWLQKTAVKKPENFQKWRIIRVGQVTENQGKMEIGELCRNMGNLIWKIRRQCDMDKFAKTVKQKRLLNSSTPF